MRKTWEKQPCRQQGQWRRRGRRCSRHWSRFPCSPQRRQQWHRLSPCSPLRTILEQISTLQPAEGSPRWSRLLAGPWSCRGPTLEQFVPEGLYLMRRAHAGAVLEELQPMGRTHVGEACEGLHLLVRTHVEVGEKVWGRSGRDERLWTAHNFLSPLCCSTGKGEDKRVGKEGVKLNLERRGLGRRCL